MVRVDRRIVRLAGVACALLLAACGTSSGGSEGSATTGGGSSTTTASRSAADVEKAVIRIVSRGTFAQPEDSLSAYSEVEQAGSGSGFIVDPSGIAVTNNHVVAGAASLEVYVGGSTEPVNAKVLGTSECSDIAVIDLEGDGYQTLSWYGGAADAGLEVRAAGFPLGDAEYTLTSGIVSKAKADGDTDWASVKSVIEHDANIQPGNSGGPLLAKDTNEVVAVNYAGGDPGTGTSQFFAISAELARPLVEQLRKGDVNSLGVNGRAVYDEESGVQGIWVSSVDTNAPAGGLGLEGGDIIEKIEGESLGTDGTLKEYCDILKSHDPTDKLAVQVLRFADGSRLKGEFNGDELAPFESLGPSIDEATGGLAESGGGYSDYQQVTDDAERISLEVPVEWADVDGSGVELDDGSVLPSLVAAADAGAFASDWVEPGVQVVVADGAIDDLASTLDTLSSDAIDACTDEGVEDYDDGLYTGLVHYFSACGGTASQEVTIAAQPEDGSFTVFVVMQLATDADIAVLDHVIETFQVVPV